MKTALSFFKHKYVVVVFAACLLFALVFSLVTLTTKPRLWIDEATTIEIAQNALHFGTFDIQTAPHEFTGMAIRLQSTGYPVTATLGAFSGLFGEGLTQVRIYMLMWLIALLIGLFVVTNKLFGAKKALASLLLVTTFATFYATRTAVGELPGFVFALIGLYWWFVKIPQGHRYGYYYLGLFWSIAVVSKPSVFLLLIPALILTKIFEAGELKKRFFDLLQTALGMLPTAILGLFLLVNHPFQSASWVAIVQFYKNPYSSSISQNILTNIKGIVHSTTLLYFGFFFIGILILQFFISSKTVRSFYRFVLFYAVLAFIYYLRSPGWLRYIFIGELLIFMVLPDAITLFFYKIKKWLPTSIARSGTIFAATCISLLLIIQLFQLFTSADIYYGDGPSEVAAYLNATYPNISIAFINTIEVSVLYKGDARYNVILLTGMPTIQSPSLFTKALPNLIIANPGQKIIEEDNAELINTKYQLVKTLRNYTIFKKI